MTNASRNHTLGRRAPFGGAGKASLPAQRAPRRGSDWAFTAVHSYVARPPRPQCTLNQLDPDGAMRKAAVDGPVPGALGLSGGSAEDPDRPGFRPALQLRFQTSTRDTRPAGPVYPKRPAASLCQSG